MDNLSIIIPSLNEGSLLEKTVFNILETIELRNYEIIIVNGGGTIVDRLKDLPNVHVYEIANFGGPQARNFGANLASYGSLLFCDAHIEFNQGWSRQIMFSLKMNKRCIVSPAVVVSDNKNRKGYGFTWTNSKMDMSWLPYSHPDLHEIPFAGGFCLAIDRENFYSIGQFDSGIKIWGGEDAEISLRAWLLGRRVLCNPEVEVSHVFREHHPYEIGWSEVNYNKIRLAMSHFKSERLSKVLDMIATDHELSGIIHSVLKDKVLERRETLFKKRIYDDDWFFKKFQIQDL